MRIVFNPKIEGMDHISIHNDNNKTITIKFDENRFRHHTRLIADSGSIYEHIMQDKATDKLEAIKSNLTHMVSILEMDMIHANTMIKIEYAQELLEILEMMEGEK